MSGCRVRRHHAVFILMAIQLPMFTPGHARAAASPPPPREWQGIRVKAQPATDKLWLGTLRPRLPGGSSAAMVRVLLFSA